MKSSDEKRLSHYRRFLYETGALDKGKGAQIEEKVLESERKKDFQVTRAMRFKYRTRYFTDSGIIGTKAFVADTFQQFDGAWNAPYQDALRHRHPVTNASRVND